ncbi:hypothetical protein TanjilG_07104 [Lupinus angustifolius]|uniref:DUF1677 family protein n=1 Tax=Lupinus angustifolius TaxID=3871 RepID=A0A4P1QXX7_LUPAN|nr:PREDICTED: uncharacterized protein LOC109327928 [Lupinus angustifolius]OIV97352.1 hypothetical protein TanjilG_07104 [Lupinus angustifolius]
MTTLGSESHLTTNKTPPQAQVEIECVKCDSCGFTEECTLAYISRLRNRFHGRWLCGLCVEAVKDEVKRSERLISTEEALNRHTRFFSDFRSATSSNKIEHPIRAMGRVLRRSLDTSKRPLRSNSFASMAPLNEGLAQQSLARSESCFPSISG